MTILGFHPELKQNLWARPLKSALSLSARGGLRLLEGWGPLILHSCLPEATCSSLLVGVGALGLPRSAMVHWG